MTGDAAWLESQVLRFLELSEQEPTLTVDAFLAGHADAESGMRARLRARILALREADAELHRAATPHGLHPGMRIGDFLIAERLGQGGMGEVFRATQGSLGRPVAVKAPSWASGPQERERLRREARIVAGLRHPGIVPLYQLVEHGPTPLLVMELVEGRSLAEVLAAIRAGELPHDGSALGRPGARYQDAALAILDQMLDALDYAHGHGVIHRDIKPANLMLDRDGRARLLDFGVARQESLDTMTRAGELIGTLLYLPPEAHAQAAAGTWTDIYACGVLAFELLTLGSPFGKGPLAAQLQRARSGDLLQAHQVDPTVARDLSAILDVAMARAPHRRHPSAAAFGAEVRRARRGEPVLARPPGLAERIVRRVRRRPEASIAVGVVLVVLLAAALVLITEAQSSARAARAELLRATADAERAAMAGRPREGLLALQQALRAAAPRLPTAALAAGEALAVDLEVIAGAEELRRRFILKPLGYCWFDDETTTDRTVGTDQYAALLGILGITAAVDPESLATRLRHRRRAPAVVAALDGWFACGVERNEATASGRERLVLANALDADPARRAVRATVLAGEHKKLQELINSPDLATADPGILDLALRVLHNGRPAAKAAAYQRIQVLHPDDYRIHAQTAYALSEWLESGAAQPEQGALQDAVIASWRLAVAARPEDPFTWANLGTACARLGRRDEAIHAYRRSIGLDPRAPRTLINLGLVLRDAERPAEALTTFDRATETAISCGCLRSAGNAQREAGLTSGRTNDLHSARRNFQRAAELSPLDGDIRNDLGYTLLKLGETEAAERELRAGLAVRPTTHLWGNLAELCAGRRQPIEAARCWRSAALVDVPGDGALGFLERGILALEAAADQSSLATIRDEAQAWSAEQALTSFWGQLAGHGPATRQRAGRLRRRLDTLGRD